jgi:hypothetical protein
MAGGAALTDRQGHLRPRPVYQEAGYLVECGRGRGGWWQTVQAYGSRDNLGCLAG